MKPQSRHLIHLGINFLTVPVPVITRQISLRFQQAVLSQGLDFQRSDFINNMIVLAREVPAPLEIRVAIADPQGQIGQVVVVAPSSSESLELFIQSAEAALIAFAEVWPVHNRQLIHCDATIRELYETTNEHAFKELWEQRLGQSASALAIFERPVRGGGLRFVLDPQSNEGDPTQVDIKIESFIQDSSKIFLETQFAWRTPTTQDPPFRVRERINQMNSYITTHIHRFITGEAK